MAPNEFGLLRRKGVRTIIGFDPIERHDRKHQPGTVTLCYRTAPTPNPQDNLLEMLKYALDHSQP